MLQPPGGDLGRAGPHRGQGVEDRRDGEQRQHQGGQQGPGRLQGGSRRPGLEGLSWNHHNIILDIHILESAWLLHPALKHHCIYLNIYQ